MLYSIGNPVEPIDRDLDAFEDYLNACDANDIEPKDFEDWKFERAIAARRVDDERAADQWSDLYE